MGCIDAYREALTRDFSSTAPSAPTSTPGPSQPPDAESDLESERNWTPAESYTVAGPCIPENTLAAAEFGSVGKEYYGTTPTMLPPIAVVPGKLREPG